MPVSLLQDSSLLAVNVGASSTRAVLFDVVEGQYRFIASGKAPSTAEAPFKDLSIGVVQAIANLQEVTGKIFLDQRNYIIKPMQPDGTGVDAFAATMSAGTALRAVVVGLLSDVSVKSAKRLAESTYQQVIDVFDLNDQRKPDEQIDAILHARPDLVIVAGGTDDGATRSLQKVLESVGLACYLTPEEKRPAILYAGNQSLKDVVKETLESLTPSLHFSPNIRPSLDTEDLAPASRELAQVFSDMRKRQMPGTEMLVDWTGGRVLPAAYAEGRMIRFLSQLSGRARGILGIDLGTTATMIAAGFNGKLTLGTYPQYGLGENLPNLLHYTQLEDIMRWLHLDISPSVVRDYLYQTSLYSGTVPVTKEEHAIEQAISRQVLYLAMNETKRHFPEEARYLKQELTPLFEPIIAGGAILSDAPTPGQSLLLLLDAIQPVGMTSIILDQNNLLPLLGAAAETNPLLPVQVLESGAFMSMGTVISVISSAKYGTPVLKAKLTYEDGTDARVDVKFGGLEILPLGVGQTARLTLRPLHHADIGNGPGRNAAVRVVGGLMGVVLDARGRPMVLPEDPVRRRDLFKKWLFSVGG